MINTQKLKKLRKEKKLTQAKMAHNLNIERTTYVRYENGEINPPTDMINKIAKFHNITIDYLFDNTDNPTPLNQSKNNISLPEAGTIEWFKQGLIKYGIVKDGSTLTDVQLQFLLDNVSFIADQLRDKQIKNNDK